MAYTPTSWKDRAVQYAKRYFLRDNGGSDKNLLPPFNEGWTLHENTRMKQANYVGKVSGSTTANPHIARSSTSIGLQSPGGGGEFAGGYASVSVLDGTSVTVSTSTNTAQSQNIFSFDLIEHVLRNYGSSVFGVAVTTPERVAWIKANVFKTMCNWYGHGSYPTGNKASLSRWNGSSWVAVSTNTASTPTLIQKSMSSADLSTAVDANGFVHFIAYADASNGTTASTINTDFVELEVYMATGSIPQADYSLELRATAADQLSTSELIHVLPSTAYTVSVTGAGAGARLDVDQFDVNSVEILSGAPGSVSAVGSVVFTFTTNAATSYINVAFYSSSAGLTTFTNPQLELGSSATTFAPMKTYDVTQAPGIVTQAGTPLNAANLNIIETGVAAAHAAGHATDTLIGNRTITDSTAQTGGAAATLTTLIGQIGNMIKAITGKSNWYTPPVTTIEALSTKKLLLARGSIQSFSKATTPVTTTFSPIDSRTLDSSATSTTLEFESTSSNRKFTFYGAPTLFDFVGNIEFIFQSNGSGNDNFVEFRYSVSGGAETVLYSSPDLDATSTGWMSFPLNIVGATSIDFRIYSKSTNVNVTHTTDIRCLTTAIKAYIG